MKILIALFSAELAQKFAQALNERGHTVATEVCSATEVRAAMKNAPDLLLFDQANADLEFLRWLKKVKEAASTAALKVLAVTNSTTVGEMEKLFLSGVDECVVRPFRLGDILDKIEKLFAATDAPSTVSLDDTLYNHVPAVLHQRIETIRNTARLLGDIAEIYSGISATSSRGHRLLCPSPEWTPTLTEKSVEPFFVNDEREFYLLKRNLVQRLPEAHEYDVAEKVLVRRIMSPLTAALDFSRLPFSKEVFGIVPVKGLDAGYLAGIFNSRLAHFYFHRYRPPGEGMHGVYFSRADLEALPIIIVKPREQAVLTAYAKQLALISPKTKNDAKKLECRKIINEINRQIFKLYGFTDEEVKLLGTLHY